MSDALGSLACELCSCLDARLAWTEPASSAHPRLSPLSQHTHQLITHKSDPQISSGFHPTRTHGETALGWFPAGSAMRNPPEMPSCCHCWERSPLIPAASSVASQIHRTKPCLVPHTRFLAARTPHPCCWRRPNPPPSPALASSICTLLLILPSVLRFHWPVPSVVRFHQSGCWNSWCSGAPQASGETLR